MTTLNPLWLLAGLVAVAAGAALVSVIVAGHVVAVAIAGAVIAYGIYVWQSRRLARFEREVEDREP